MSPVPMHTGWLRSAWHTAAAPVVVCAHSVSPQKQTMRPYCKGPERRCRAQQPALENHAVCWVYAEVTPTLPVGMSPAHTDRQDGAACRKVLYIIRKPQQCCDPHAAVRAQEPRWKFTCVTLTRGHKQVAADSTEQERWLTKAYQHATHKRNPAD